ncbi:unnamed protein product, partial [Rotaria magnacalcarata]
MSTSSALALITGAGQDFGVALLAVLGVVITIGVGMLVFRVEDFGSGGLTFASTTLTVLNTGTATFSQFGVSKPVTTDSNHGIEIYLQKISGGGTGTECTAFYGLKNNSATLGNWNSMPTIPSYSLIATSTGNHSGFGNCDAITFEAGATWRLNFSYANIGENDTEFAWRGTESNPYFMMSTDGLFPDDPGGNDPFQSRIDTFTYSTTTRIATITGYWNTHATSSEVLTFYQESVLLGQESFVTVTATTSGNFSQSFEFLGIPSPSSGGTTTP